MLNRQSIHFYISMLYHYVIPTLYILIFSYCILYINIITILEIILIERQIKTAFVLRIIHWKQKLPTDYILSYIFSAVTLHLENYGVNK